LYSYRKFVLAKVASGLSAGAWAVALMSPRSLEALLSPASLTELIFSPVPLITISLLFTSSALLAAIKRPWALSAYLAYLILPSVGFAYSPPTLLKALLPLAAFLLVAFLYPKKRARSYIMAGSGAGALALLYDNGSTLLGASILALISLIAAVERVSVKVDKYEVSCSGQTVDIRVTLKGDLDVLVPDLLRVESGLNRALVLSRSSASEAEYKGSGNVDRGGKYPIKASFRGKTFKLGKVEIPDPISLKLFTAGKEVRLEVRKGDKPYDPKTLVASVDGKPASLRRVSKGVYEFLDEGESYRATVREGSCFSEAELDLVPSPKARVQGAVQVYQPPVSVQSGQANVAPLSVTPSDPFLGRTVYGYSITRRVGEGGFSHVYEALKEGSKFAVKVPKLETIMGSGSLDKLAEILKEVQGLSLALSGQAPVVKLQGVFVDYQDLKSIASGKLNVYYERPPAIIMEFMEGGNAYDLMMNDVLFYSEEWPTAVFIIISEIADALAEIHKAGFVHSDVKPQNVMFGSRPPLTGKELLNALRSGTLEVKLGDLGNAVRSGGSPIGFTPQYASLEQVIAVCRSDPAEGVLPVDDVYALGATTFSLLTRATLNSDEMIAAINSVRDCKDVNLIRRERLRLYSTRDYRPLMEALKSSIYSARAQEVVNFVMRMTAPERSQRPSALEVSKFFKGLH